MELSASTSANLTMSFICSHCSFRSSFWRELLKHSFECHSNEPNFLEKCKIDGCTQTFRCYSTFNSHISRKHRGMDIESEARKSARTEEISSDLDEDALGGDDSERGDNSETDTETVDNSVDDSTVTAASQLSEDNEPSDNGEISSNQDRLCGGARLQKSAALFLLSAKERFHLTQSALNFVTQQVQQMVSFAVDDIEEAVKKHLNDCGVTMQDTQLAAQFEVMRDPFSSLQTEYLQTKFYREKFNLVVSSFFLFN